MAEPEILIGKSLVPIS